MPSSLAMKCLIVFPLSALTGLLHGCGGGAPTPVATPSPTPSPGPPSPSPTASPTTSPTASPTVSPTPVASNASIVASFAVLGDWGYNAACHAPGFGPQCQDMIGNIMKDFLEEQGDKFKFILNVGDSFYCDGVGAKDDPRWQTVWRNHYSDANRARDLTTVPWYSVYGNHDFGAQDPCLCDGNCHQVNSGIPNFVMPNLTYHIPDTQLNVEIIGMDTNFDDAGSICTYMHDCSREICTRNLDQHTKDAIDYFNHRYDASPAKTLLVFQHYPIDFLMGLHPEFFKRLTDNSKHDIVFFGGHRHSTDNVGSGISPNTYWLVGGGGGYSCDGPAQGFVKGFIHADGKVTTEKQLVPPAPCCSNLGSHGPAATAAGGAGSIEAVTCAKGSNCTSTVLHQGECHRIHGDVGLVRLWCETGDDQVKVDEMDMECNWPRAFHYVSLNKPVSARHNPTVETVEYRCDRVSSLPQGWQKPQFVAMPHHTATLRTLRFDVDDIFAI